MFSDYNCGSNWGWSSLYWFRTLPASDNWVPRLAVFGDLGNYNAISLPALQTETQMGMYDAILHVGDFAYDMELVFVYNTKFYLKSLFASIIQYIHFLE